MPVDVTGWKCPDCGGDLADDLFAQFGLWCGKCERVIPWPKVVRRGD